MKDIRWSNGVIKKDITPEEFERRNKARRKRRKKQGYPCQGNYLDVNKY